MLFDEHVAIVTGASRGLGRSIALALAAEGAHLALVYRQQEAAARAVQQEIERQGGQALTIQADVSSEPAVEAMVGRVLAAYGKVDILINGAGLSLDGVTWRLPSESWSQVIQTNLTGTFYCTKYVLPSMRAQKYGRIVNITSIVGQTGVAGTAAYAASKAGIIGFTRTSAVEVAKAGVTVNAVALGYIDEGMGRALPPEVHDRVLGTIPVGRFGTPDELNWVIRFLCAPGASYITGSVLNVNGGLYG